jgi:hypothetical protein
VFHLNTDPDIKKKRKFPKILLIGKLVQLFCCLKNAISKFESVESETRERERDKDEQEDENGGPSRLE